MSLSLHLFARLVKSRKVNVPGGRPTDYSIELADRICVELCEGKNLGQVCRMDGMPSPGTVYTWLQRHAEFAEKYAQARKIQAEVLVTQLLDLADEDVIEGDRSDSARVNQQRLKLDTRKWYVSKVLPKLYGERVEEERGQDRLDEVLAAQKAALAAMKEAQKTPAPEIVEPPKKPE